MEEPEEQEQLAEEQQGETAKELKLTMRIDARWYEEVRDVANYAAAIGLIPDDHRGNITAWINYCLHVVENELKRQEKINREL